MARIVRAPRSAVYGALVSPGFEKMCFRHMPIRYSGGLVKVIPKTDNLWDGPLDSGPVQICWHRISRVAG